jgi:hypothetical protein
VADKTSEDTMTKKDETRMAGYVLGYASIANRADNPHPEGSQDHRDWRYGYRLGLETRRDRRKFDSLRLVKKMNRLHTEWSVDGVSFADLRKRHKVKGKRLRLCDWRADYANVTCIVHVPNGTWLDLWKSADFLVGKVTQHWRRYYIEGFRKTGPFVDLITGT